MPRREGSPMAAVLRGFPIPDPLPHAGSGRLRGFRSGAREIDDVEVAVAGELPAWLRGRLLLDGPAGRGLPHGAYRHWFNGLAMLHALRFEDGRVRYPSRFL